MSSKAVPGLLFVVSAPSGTGKTTVVERLVSRVPQLKQSTSYTSRPARPGEKDGQDYHFITRQDFEDKIRRGEFLEWADVFGNLYGTRRADTDADLGAGRDVVLVIDVHGARQVRERVPGSVAIFVLPPSFSALERRLRGRNGDPDPAITLRLETARSEVSVVDEYDYVVVNDDLERCVGEIEAIVTAERAKRARKAPVIEPIVATFRR